MVQPRPCQMSARRLPVMVWARRAAHPVSMVAVMFHPCAWTVAVVSGPSVSRTAGMDRSGGMRFMVVPVRR